MEPKKLIVKAAIKNEDGEFLVLRRAAAEHFFPDVWDFPGGRVEEGESETEALEREVEEETSLQVKTAEELNRYELVEKDTPLEFSVFAVEAGSGEVSINPEEYSEFKWASMAEVLESPHSPFLDLYFAEHPDA